MAPPTPLTSLTENSLNKLTSKDLKSLCKERRLVGYSKLTKTALVLKILNGQQTVSENIAASPHRKPTSSRSPANVLSRRLTDKPDVSPPKPASEEPNSSVSVLIVEQTPVPPHTTNPQQSNRLEASTVTNDSSLRVASTTTKRPAKDIESGIHFTVNKKAKINAYPSIMATVPEALLQRASSSKPSSDRMSGTNKVDNGRRFRHLMPKLRTAPIDAYNQSVDTLAVVSVDFGDCLESCSPRLSSITLPPSMAQRKHVPRLSLILRDISMDDLKSCALVSRLFRYCAYSAAYIQLRRYFSGSRLSIVLSQYPVQVTNFWPYLLRRVNEAEQRKQMYEASFVGRHLKNKYCVHENVWKSCDNHKEASIIMRFLSTQLFFIVSVGHGLNRVRFDETSCEEIIKAEEIIANEIWKIIVKSSSCGIHKYYVIEPTCEIIGRHTKSGMRDCSATDRLRLDWEHYIECRSQAPTIPISNGQVNPHGGLSNYLHWLNHEEYDKGISKVWLSKIKKENPCSSMKLLVAQRYIMACVVGNSLSGAQLTVNEMIQQYNGIPLGAVNTAIRPRKNQRIRLFLPEHHHLESLHFDTVSRKPLHEALAIVQTPARQYYILKDNGMQVGSEEDGVADVWMEIIGCKKDGGI